MALEPRYVVFKIKDMLEFLSEEELKTIDRLQDKVDEQRRASGKLSLDCVVVESDWSMFTQVVTAVLEAGRDKSAKKPTVFDLADQPASNF